MKTVGRVGQDYLIQVTYDECMRLGLPHDSEPGDEHELAPILASANTAHAGFKEVAVVVDRMRDAVALYERVKEKIQENQTLANP